jgi:signal transduction histidine kinase/ActR/RegA family two-component response regulator
MPLLRQLLEFIRLQIMPGSIRSRILYIALIPSLLTAILLTAYFVQNKLDEAERDAKDQLHRAARTVAAASQYAMISGNDALLAQVISRERLAEQLDYAQACDISNIGLNRCGWQQENAPVSPLKPGQIETIAGVWFASHPVTLPEIQIDTDLIDTSHLKEPAQKVVGHVTVGLNSEPVLAGQKKVMLSAAALVLAVITLTFMVAWRLSSRLTHQVQDISHAVERIARGELNVRVRETSREEMGHLESGINRLAEALTGSQLNMQARIAEATAGLAAKKEEAERANIAKSRFFAAASHDLRQPMHAISLFVGALKEHGRHPEIGPLIDHIDASVSAMETLFNSLLDISRLDAGVLEVHKEHFSARRLFDRVSQQYAEVAREKGLRFIVRPFPVTLYSDPILLERILLNLVSNAIRYTHDGGILVAGRMRGKNLLIQVYDTGLGIPESSREAIFQEFVQLNNPARDRKKGLGLGLAIVSRLARLLDQRIQVKSRTNRGSVFSVEVPLGSSQEVSRPASLPATAGVRLDGKLAVLVDDEEAILRAMEELFDSWKIDLVTARNVEEAVDWVRSLDRSPDILISDFRLPENINGIEVVNYLRMCFGKHLPALILTGDTAPETLQKINEAGLHIMHKPIRPARLRSLIMHLISQATVASSSP